MEDLQIIAPATRPTEGFHYLHMPPNQMDP